MVDWTTVNSTRVAHCTSGESGDCHGCVCNLDDSSIVLADSCVSSRAVEAHGANTAIRPLSVLANLLTPFAGPHAQQLAARFIDRFGSIDRLVAASEDQIVHACKERADIGHMIAGARALVLAGLQETVTRAPVDPSDPKLTHYLTAKFKGRPHEELHALFVDHDHGFLAEELVSTGDVHRVEARIGPIMRRAFELRANGLYLVHNHPSNSPLPSAEDIRATKHITSVARALDVTVFDHLIVAGSRVTSMRRLNLL